MDFDFTEEQKILSKTARDFLESHCPSSFVLEMEEDEKGYTEELWRGMAELGWQALIIPEKYDGVGGDLVDLVIMLEEMGRVCLPGPFFSTVALGCLSLLEMRSAQQVFHWRTSASLWAHCVNVAPDNPVCHRALADSLAEQGKLSQAKPHYLKALELEPEYVDVMRNFSFYLVTCQDEALRNDRLAIELAHEGCRLTQNQDPGLVRTLAMAYTNRGATAERDRRFAAAIRDYDRAIQVDPHYEVALFNLALLLSTCDDPDLRDPPRAVRLAERASGLIERPGPSRLSILAAAYAATGRFADAVAAAQAALELADGGHQVYLVEKGPSIGGIMSALDKTFPTMDCSI